MAEADLEVLGGEDALADLEADDIGDQRHREANAATVAALPASTSRRAGMAANVVRIMPGGVLGGYRPYGERTRAARRRS